jgi:hypothetical protein
MGVYHIHETDITDNVYIVLGESLYNGHFSRRDGNKVTFWLQSRENWMCVFDDEEIKSWVCTTILITDYLDVVGKWRKEYVGVRRCAENVFRRKINGKWLDIELTLWKDKCFVTNDYREALEEVKRRINNG